MAQVITTAIPNGAARTEPIDNIGWSILGVILNGSAWTAADLGVEVSADRTTWVLLKDQVGDGVRITSLPTGAAFARSFGNKYTDILAFPYIRLVSINTASDADVNQGAARNFWIVLKK